MHVGLYSALTASANKKDISIPFNDYQSVFNYLVKNVSMEDRLYVLCYCMTICIDMQLNQEEVKSNLINKRNDDIAVPFLNLRKCLLLPRSVLIFSD